jgi:endothelin-converting enzyme
MPILDLPNLVRKITPEGYSEERVKLAFPDNIQEFNKIFMATSKETLQTYFLWKVIYYSVSNGRIMSEETRALDRFIKVLDGKVSPVIYEQPRKVRWEHFSGETLALILRRTEPRRRARSIDCVPRPHARRVLFGLGS